MIPSDSYPYNPQLFSDDERLARELFQQEQDEQLARELQSQRQEEIRRSSQLEQQDAAVACEMEQQMRDEEYARQLALAEEPAMAPQQQNSPNVVGAAMPTPSRRKRWCATLVPCLLIGVGVLVVWWFFLRGTSTAVAGGGGNVGIQIPWFTDPNPFEEMEPGQVAKWKTYSNDNGLALTLVNALDEDWQDIFAKVVQDWDNGTPDALSLTVERVAPDATCTPVTGTSKVCNGNYGRTDWKGVNYNLFRFGYIAASTSRVNDYNLSRDTTTAERRYVLCHEIGHSFGLPHADESFYNRDLGNCMDYAQTPAANQSPDETNYQFLAELYGTIMPTADRPQNTGVRRRTTRQSSFDVPDHVLQAMDPQGERALVGKQQQGVQSIHWEDGWSLQIHKITA